jgi:ABC-type branched-subunit amino acid transport system substrate-binding protein
MRQAAEQNLGIPMAGGVDSPYLASIEKELVDGKIDILEGMYFYSDYIQGAKEAEVEKFDAAFRKKFNMPPLDINYEGWLSLSLIVKALQAPGAAEGGDKLRASLQDIKLDLGGRVVSFLENGDQATLVTYIGQLNKGNPELIELVKTERKSYPLAQ